jgi:hypothetical protein
MAHETERGMADPSARLHVARRYLLVAFGILLGVAAVLVGETTAHDTRSYFSQGVLQTRPSSGPGPVPPAAVGPWPKVAHLRDSGSGLCLDRDTASNLFTSPCADVSSQEWTVTGVGTSVSVAGAGSDLCLDASVVGNLYLAQCTGAASRDWDPISRAPLVLTDVITGWCLDSNRIRWAYTVDCDEDQFQQWTLVADR